MSRALLKVKPEVHKLAKIAMTGLDRKIELMRKRVTMTRLATELGVSVSVVAQVVRGRTRSARIEAAVAKAIGKPVNRVFPPSAA